MRTRGTQRGGGDEGPEGIRRFWIDIQDARPDFKVYVDGLLAVRENRALVFVRGTACLRASRVRREVAALNVCSFLDGEIDG